MAVVRGRKKAEPAAEEMDAIEEELEEELAEDEVEEDDTDGDDAGDDLDDLELDETEDEDEEADEEPTPAPKSRRGRKPAAKKETTPKRPAIEFGTAELLAHIESETGKLYDGRALRVLLRKMKAANELPGEHGQRYSFTGPDDAKVVAIVKRIKSGEIEEAQKAALDKLKEDADAKRAAKKAAKEAQEAAAAQEDDEDEEEEPAPKPAPRRRPAAKKTTTSTRRAPGRRKATDAAGEDEDGEE